MVAEDSSTVGIIVFAIALALYAVLYVISSRVSYRRPIYGAMVLATFVMLFIFIVERFGVGIVTRLDGVTIFPWRWIAFIFSHGALVWALAKHQRVMFYPGVAAIIYSILFDLFLFSGTLSGNDGFRWISFAFAIAAFAFTFLSLGNRTRVSMHSTIAFVLYAVFLAIYHVVWAISAGGDIIDFSAGEWVFLIWDALFFVPYGLFLGYTVGQDVSQAPYSAQGSPNSWEYL